MQVPTAWSAVVMWAGERMPHAVPWAASSSAKMPAISKVSFRKASASRIHHLLEPGAYLTIW